MNKRRIIIVDDHPMFRDALRQSISVGSDEIEILEAGELTELTDTLGQTTDVDLLLLDLTIPGVRGFSGLLLLRAQYPEIPVVIVSAREDARTVKRCIEIGASGYIPKSLPVDDIRTAVSTVLNGEIWVPSEYDLAVDSDTLEDDIVTRLTKLTPQQVRVLVMLGEGLLNKQIAHRLDISEATVKAHVSAIFQKLDVDSRTQAVITINSIDRKDWQDSQVPRFEPTDSEQ